MRRAKQIRLMGDLDNQCPDMWSSTVLSKLEMYKNTRNLTTYEHITGKIIPEK